jgi:transposase
MTVPGIGPIISSAMIAAIGNGVAFARGRDYSAWLGLVPKQMSTGDRTILGHVSKRGNGYLRMPLHSRHPANFCPFAAGQIIVAAPPLAKRSHAADAKAPFAPLS